MRMVLLVFKISLIKEVLAKHSEIFEENGEDFLVDTDVVPTGFKTLDLFCKGLIRGDVITILGPASMGKTAFIINLISKFTLRNNDNTQSILYFSLDKKPILIKEALIAHISQLDEHKIRLNILSDKEKSTIQNVTEFVNRALIHFVEGLVSLEEIEAVIHEKVITHSTRLVVIDSVSSIYGRDVLNNLKKIKEIAFNKQVTIVLTKLLSKKLDSWEKTTEDMGIGVDALTQEAIMISDMVWILHRDEYYEPTDANKGDGKLWMIKNKNGPGASIDIKFNRTGLKFTDYKEINQ